MIEFTILAEPTRPLDNCMGTYHAMLLQAQAEERELFRRSLSEAHWQALSDAYPLAVGRRCDARRNDR